MNSSAQQGFTLLELLISISIIAVISGSLIPGFSTYSRNQNLRQAQEQVKSDLRTVQNFALTGTESADNLEFWGLSFIQGSGRYEFFTAQTASDCVGDPGYTSYKQSEILPAGIVVRSASECVYFRFSDGGSPADDSVRIGYPSPATDCADVNIDSGGLITTGAAVGC